MNNTLYNFINNHQLRLANIFYSNRHAIGEGALFIDVNTAKNNVDVKFLEKKNIPEDVLPLFSKYIKNEQEKKATKKDDDKEYLVIDMSPIPNNIHLQIPDYIIYFIVKNNSKKNKAPYKYQPHHLLVGTIESFSYCGKQMNKFVFRCEVNKKNNNQNNNQNQNNNENNNQNNTNNQNKNNGDSSITTIKNAGWMIADTDAGTNFIDYCKSLFDESIDAKTRNERLRTFRSSPEFAEIITTYPRTYGDACIKMGLIDDAFINNLSKIPEEVGKPLTTHEFDFGGRTDRQLSPPHAFAVDTIRYMKTASHILRLSKTTTTLESKNSLDHIIEIGAGYGGLCHMISRVVDYKTYTILEIPELARLSEYYLKQVKLPAHLNATMTSKAKIRINPEKHQNDVIYDLCISEFGLCEFDDVTLQFYINTVLRKSRRAYLVMNIWDDAKKRKFMNKLMLFYKNVEEIAESPRTKWNNYIYYCTDNVLLTD